MGLLNQIIGGLAGNMLGRRMGGTGGVGGIGGLGGLGGLGGGKSRLMMALLPVVLGILANRQRGGGGGGGGMAGFGGSMGGLGGLAGLGGLGGLLDQFRNKGYGDQASSWVSTGPNQSLAPEALSDVFGDDQLAAIASQAGVSQDEARSGLAELLPEVVDHFTPQGQVPDDDQLLASIDDYERQLSSDSH